VKTLPRVTREHFRRGLRGFGFGDVHQGRKALEGFDAVAATGANCVRTFLSPAWDGTRYVLPAQQLADLSWYATECQRRQMYCVPALLVPQEDHARLFASLAAQQSVADIWGGLAKRYRGRLVFAGFDLLNEPKYNDATRADAYWSGIVARCVEVIDQADPQRVVIAETWPGGRVDSRPEWGEFWRPQPGNVVMSAHLYSPFPYTHADIDEWSTPGQAFDPVETLAQMHRELLYLRNEAQRHDVPVWIGELSTLQDRPGASAWARHAVELMDGFGFSWSWHQFFGWPGWHPNDDTLAVLREGLKRR
jgi:hypothetical protein